jgi:hypothetical protein
MVIIEKPTSNPAGRWSPGVKKPRAIFIQLLTGADGWMEHRPDPGHALSWRCEWGATVGSHGFKPIAKFEPGFMSEYGSDSYLKTLGPWEFYREPQTCICRQAVISLGACRVTFNMVEIVLLRTSSDISASQ